MSGAKHRPILWAVRTDWLVEVFTTKPEKAALGWFASEDGERLIDMPTERFEHYFRLRVPEYPIKIRLDANVAVNG